MATLTVPGVSIQEISTLPPSIAAVETAIPAFIGYTANHEDLETGENSPAAKPVRITSLKEFETIFGGANAETLTVTVTDTYDGSSNLTSRSVTADVESVAPTYNLYNSVQIFYANGGGPCYIVSVGDYDDSIADSNIESGIDEIRAVDEPTLLLFPEAAGLGDTDNGDVINKALLQCGDLKDRFVIGDVSSSTAISSIDTFREKITSSFLRYGALYYPGIQTSIEASYSDLSVTIDHDVIEGTAPFSLDSDTLDEVIKGTGGNSNPDPVLEQQIRTALRSVVVQLPASPAVAGVYAQTDENRGVWKAPANVALIGVSKPTVALSDLDQSGLNVDPTSGKSINAIRSFTGKGNLVWGARTLAGNDNEWRYVNVRRLFIFAEESIQKAMEQFVFEPNTAQTWLRLKGSIENFLTDLWRQGGLVGPKADDAYFVNVGLGQTMTANDINNGILNVEIGLAAARPAEFIVLKFSQQQQQS